MKIVNDLLPDSSRMNAEMAAGFIIEREQHLGEFIEACASGTGKIPMRASRVIFILSRKYPAILRPHLSRLLEIAENTSDESVSRNYLCCFEEYIDGFSEEQTGRLLTLAFRRIEERSESIVIRPVCLRLLYRLSEIYPELKAEVFSLATWLSDEPYPSCQAVAKKILLKLRKEITL